jgi:hypothetical protein
VPGGYSDESRWHLGKRSTKKIKIKIKTLKHHMTFLSSHAPARVAHGNFEQFKVSGGFSECINTPALVISTQSRRILTALG